MSPDNGEFEVYLLNKLKQPSFIEDLKKKGKCIAISNSEVNFMRSEIIKEFKPQFVSANLPADETDWEKQLLIEYFDKRINSLSKEIIIDLYDDLQAFRSIMSEDAKEKVLQHILVNLRLCYSLNGWFREEVIRAR